MLVLLPPSEGKLAPRRGKPLALESLSLPELTAPRALVLDALLALCRGDEQRAVDVLGLSPGQAHEVHSLARLDTAPTAVAASIYSGVLYAALDLATLDPAARRRATGSLWIASGLFGLVRPADRIPAYRLGGGTNLPGIGGLAAFWRRALDVPVTTAARRGPVLDLRSSTYAGYWVPGREIASRTLVGRVLQEVDRGGSLVRLPVSHFNKATKGLLVRDLLQAGPLPRDVDALVSSLTRASDLRGWSVELQPPAGTGRPRILEIVVRDLP